MLKSAVPFLLFEPDLFFPTNVDARKRKFGKFINQARGQPFMIGAFQLLDGEIGADQHRLFKIEPMVNAGTAEIYQDADNGWTIYTDDGKPSAQWEVTVAVTEDGCEVLVW